MRVLLASLVLVATSASAQVKSAADIFAQTSPSIVVVLALDPSGSPVALGSGVTIGPGQVVTNCHVIEGAYAATVRYRGKELDATLRHIDVERDVCSLSVPKLTAPRVPAIRMSNLRVGEHVLVIGAPRGLELTLSDGLISGLGNREGYIQITAPISPGSSGGGLFDDQGRLIGLPTWLLKEGQQLNFALPAQSIHELPERSADPNVALAAAGFTNFAPPVQPQEKCPAEEVRLGLCRVAREVDEAPAAIARQVSEPEQEAGGRVTEDNGPPIRDDCTPAQVRLLQCRPARVE